MSFLDYFKGGSQKKTANVAKERLQIIVAHQRGKSGQPDYMMKMQQEVLAVVRKYVEIDDEMVKFDVEQNDDCSILELNVTLPEKAVAV